MAINDFTRHGAKVLTLLALTTTGCCGADFVDEQVDRTNVDGFYQFSSRSELTIDVPTVANAGEPQTKTVVATDVSVTVQGTVVTLDFVAENQRYQYTYNMQESPRATITSP